MDKMFFKLCVFFYIIFKKLIFKKMANPNIIYFDYYQGILETHNSWILVTLCHDHSLFPEWGNFKNLS